MSFFFFGSFFLLSLTEYVLVKRENVSFSAHFQTTANTFSFEREFLSVNIYVKLRGGEGKKKKKRRSLSSTQSEKMPGWRAAAARGDEILYLALISIGNISLMVKLSVSVRLHEINVYQSSLQVCWDTFFFFFCHIWCLLVLLCNTIRLCNCLLAATRLRSRVWERFKCEVFGVCDVLLFAVSPVRCDCDDCFSCRVSIYLTKNKHREETLVTCVILPVAGFISAPEWAAPNTSQSISKRLAVDNIEQWNMNKKKKKERDE